MDFQDWQQRDSDTGDDSSDFDSGMHDESCEGCLRIAKAEQERFRLRSGGGGEEQGVDQAGKHEIDRAIVCYSILECGRRRG